MIPLAGGWFHMGASASPHPEDGEAPERKVFVDPFSLSSAAVTIADFARFVAATGYETLAERSGGSFVFHSFTDPSADYPAAAHAPWWRLVPTACWHAPDGVAGSGKSTPDHPVTHVALQDALAYCKWSGTRLLSEAEWEFAARGGLERQPFPWGDQLEPDGEHRCNVWQGQFPKTNSAADGYAGTAPVTAFQPNDFGLHNMTGNVWEWVADRFTTLHSPRPVKNPRGALNGAQFVAKGGSYLCHATYCSRYTVSARQGLAPDTTTGNVGFRVAAKSPALSA
nr:formylglycine-generating enzyme family protein [Amylibacter sp.]